jgi:hypothetical protein
VLARSNQAPKTAVPATCDQRLTWRRRQSDDVSFATFIDDQIADARAAIERAQHKLAVLEELRRDYAAKPGRFAPCNGTRLPPRQLLATQAMAAYLKHKAQPVPTTALLRYLEEQGIKFGGRQPRNTLSVLLSRSNRFVAHGRRGWSVVDNEER